MSKNMHLKKCSREIEMYQSMLIGLFRQQLKARLVSKSAKGWEQSVTCTVRDQWMMSYVCLINI